MATALDVWLLTTGYLLVACFFAAQRLAKEYDIPPYLRSRLDMLQRELDQLFQGKRGPAQLELTDFVSAN